MGKTNARAELFGLQALRAAAAIAVVAVHAADYLKEKNGVVPPQLTWFHGVAGVDLFFVISGLVMTISTANSKGGARAARVFFWRRLQRIAPLYWMLTALKVGLVWLSPSLSTRGMSSGWNIVASFLFIPSLGPGGELRPVIPVGWTLSFEMAFYVLFALAMVLARRRWILLTLAVLCLAGLGFARKDTWPAWTALADPIVLEFLAGAGIGWLLRSAKLPGRLASIALLTGGIAGIVLFSPANNAQRPLVWGFPAAMIVLGMLGLEGMIGCRLPKWLLQLGDASYSIYLIQGFVFPLVHLPFSRGAGLRMVHERPVEAGVGMIALSLLMVPWAGMALYWWVERPVTLFLNSKRTASMKPVREREPTSF